jgi:hypothetical protein
MGTTPKTMATNVGGMERMIRVVAGIAILYFTMAGMIPMPWGLIGIVPILTDLWVGVQCIFHLESIQ